MSISAILHDPFLWAYVLAAFFAVCVIVPIVIVVRSRQTEAGTSADDADGLPVAKIIDDPKVLVPHLKDLRQKLTRAAVALIVCVAISFIFSKQLLNILTGPIGGLGQLQAIEVTEPISVFMRVALITGFVMALPYIFAQLWLFIAPGLKPNEFRYIFYLLPGAVILFLAGAAFAYFVMLPVAIPFLVGFMGIPTTPRPANYIKFITALTFWVGVSFETPLVSFVLARLGLVTAKGLLKRWRYAIVLIAVIAAVITPTIDPVNMSLVMAPLIVLYFLSIVLARIAYRPRQTEQ